MFEHVLNVWELVRLRGEHALKLLSPTWRNGGASYSIIYQQIVNESWRFLTNGSLITFLGEVYLRNVSWRTFLANVPGGRSWRTFFANVLCEMFLRERSLRTVLRELSLRTFFANVLREMFLRERSLRTFFANVLCERSLRNVLCELSLRNVSSRTFFANVL